MNRKFEVAVFVFALLLCAWCLPLSAQVNSGSLTGSVKDTSDAFIPAATVTVRDLGTGQTRVATSGTRGEFAITNLAPGHYSITTAHAGFRTVVTPDFELLVSQQAAYNPILSVGEVSTTVQVTSESALLSTDTSSVGQVIDSKLVSTIPVNGRNFWSLTQLTPGVSYIPGSQASSFGGGSIRASVVNIYVNGHPSVFTGWYLDGAYITEPQLGGTIIQPSVDAIQEFRVEGGNMGAEFGHDPTLINSTVKGGSNAFHGLLYEYVRNNAFDAKNYFYTPPTGSTRRNQPLHRNQFGGTLGGPILHDKTFFFVDVESLRLSQGQVYNSVVPSLAERGGNFSQITKQLVNPATGIAYPGNIIPAISPQAQFFLKYLPLPNLVIGGTSHALATVPVVINQVKGDLRIDQQLGASNHIFGRYSISDNQESDPNAYPAEGVNPLTSRGQNLVINWTHIFSPQWVNSLQLAYYRSLFNFASAFTGQDINDQAGIGGLQGLSTPATVGIPSLSISNYSSFTGQISTNYPKLNRLRSPQLSDTVSFSNGKNTVKVGFELIHNTLMFENAGTANGSFFFNNAYSGDNFADFLLGYPSNGTRASAFNLYGYIGTFQSYYVQDDYHFRNNLTINAGLRWEVQPFYYGDKGQITGFDTATGKIVIPSNLASNAQPLTASLLSVFSDRLESTSQLGLPVSIRPTAKHDVAPRLGFAYAPGSGKTAIRGAYGIFFILPDNNYINLTAQSIPIYASQVINNSVGPTGQNLTLANFFGSSPIAAPNPNPGSPCSFGMTLLSCSQVAVTSANLKLQQAYVSEWNFAVQRQMGTKTSIDVAYVGNNTNHGMRGTSLNDPAPAAGNIQARRPLPQWGTVSSADSGGNGNYNALQAKVEVRAPHGATLLASYTFSRCMDNATYNGNRIEIPNTFGGGYYGPCDANRKHNFVTSAVYDLPVGRGRAFLGDLPAWANTVLGGWEVSGVGTLQSGLPYQPTIGSDVANTGVGSQRPNVVGKPLTLKSPSCWFYVAANASCKILAPGATSAYAVPAAFTYGNLSRNPLYGDDLINFDVAADKAFSLGRERSLEFRAQFYNVFNHTTFSNPSTSIDQSSGGTVSSTLTSARDVEFALRFSF